MTFEGLRRSEEDGDEIEGGVEDVLFRKLVFVDFNVIITMIKNNNKQRSI